MNEVHWDGKGNMIVGQKVDPHQFGGGRGFGWGWLAVVILIALSALLVACGVDGKSKSDAKPAATATPLPLNKQNVQLVSAEFQDDVTGFYVVEPIASWYWKNDPNNKVGRPTSAMSGDENPGYLTQHFEWGVVKVETKSKKITFEPNGESPYEKGKKK